MVEYNEMGIGVREDKIKKEMWLFKGSWTKRKDVTKWTETPYDK